ncbi:MAG: methylmalonyl-CoA mutase [Peptococcaceae bacterium BRH_c4b]|nr:MAG: methylmalonyl-CoA mutase [Peptococcaceae bacterium BRH_c4b]
MINKDDIENIKKSREAWQDNTLSKLPPCQAKFETVSDIPIKDIYTPEDIKDLDYLRDLGFPGEYPFTRGAYAPMNRGRQWVIRQVVGVGTAEETNKRHKFVMQQGQTGMSNDFDLPTLIGLDSDDPLAVGEVGRVGVSIDSLEDMEKLYNGIPLEKANHSFTINHPTVAILSMFIALVEKQGLSMEKIAGTTQNDPLKECFAMKVFVFPPKASVKMLVDTWEYAARFLPKWNISNLNGYPTRDSGGTVYHELGLTFASGIQYFDEAIKRGIDVDAIAPRISLMWYVHKDFLEEIAKFRAARRIWAKIMKERYHAINPQSWKLRMHAQTGGATYTFQQPENNIVRGTIGGMAAVLGGVQSLAIACYDEALSIPSEKAHKLSIRTQQVIAHESGVTSVVDPFAGSYYMEWLTNEVEERTWKIINDIEERGGLAVCTENGYIDRMLANQVYEYNKAVEKGEQIVVGVNAFADEEEKGKLPSEKDIFRVSSDNEEKQIASLKRLKRERNQLAVKNALDDLLRASEKNENVMPYCIAAAKAYCTEGEIIGALKKVYGEYEPSTI